MATLAPMARVPFAPLDNPRLQHLANAKNRQNGIIAQQSAKVEGKIGMPLGVSTSSKKRTLDATVFDDGAMFDGENIDPAMFASPSKKCKSSGPFDVPLKPFAFTFGPAKTSMPPPPTVPARFSTPARPSLSTTRTPLTAPAGRSPKRKTAVGFGKIRRTSAPFSRIDPPFSTSPPSGLPFSLDAALSGTLSSSKAPMAEVEAPMDEVEAPMDEVEPPVASATPKEMPESWFFDIYEDTPEELAATLMEHSTLTLDLSSDDESDTCGPRNDRGKENTPPECYSAAAASRPVGIQQWSSLTSLLSDTSSTSTEEVYTPDKPRLVRKKVSVDAMEDGERTPLAELEPDPFFFATTEFNFEEVEVTETIEAIETIETTEKVEETEKLEETEEGEKLEETEETEKLVEPEGEIVVWEDAKHE